MSRFLWLFLILLVCLVWIIALVLWLNKSDYAREALPTLVQFPTLTQTNTASPRPSSTVSPSPTNTELPAITAIPSSTTTLVPTPTLSVRLLEITAIMPDVLLPASPTALPFGMNIAYSAPMPIEPLPDATNEAPPFIGWHSFESDYPQVRYRGLWSPRQVLEASRGQYHRHEQGIGSVSFAFEGQALRLRYVAARNMGIFEIYVDGQLLDSIDAYSLELAFPSSQVYLLSAGQHILELRATGRKNPQSEGITVGLDAIQVFLPEANNLIVVPAPYNSTPSPSPQVAKSIELIQAPATIQATASPIPPVEILISVVVAYDENGNREIEPAEGVLGIPVRVVNANSNQVLAQAMTNSQGFAFLQVVTDAPARVVIPYFGEVWDLPRNHRAGSVAFSLLLQPGNQPAIIP